jgi:hypothetical protein
MTAAAQAVLLTAAKRGAKAPLYPNSLDYSNSENALALSEKLWGTAKT